MESTDVRDELDYILQPDITQQEGFPEKSESESIILFFFFFLKLFSPFTNSFQNQEFHIF